MRCLKEDAMGSFLKLKKGKVCRLAGPYFLIRSEYIDTPSIKSRLLRLFILPGDNEESFIESGIQQQGSHS